MWALPKRRRRLVKVSGAEGQRTRVIGAGPAGSPTSTFISMPSQAEIWRRSSLGSRARSQQSARQPLLHRALRHVSCGCARISSCHIPVTFCIARAPPHPLQFLISRLPQPHSMGICSSCLGGRADEDVSSTAGRIWALSRLLTRPCSSRTHRSSLEMATSRSTARSRPARSIPRSLIQKRSAVLARSSSRSVPTPPGECGASPAPWHPLLP